MRRLSAFATAHTAFTHPLIAARQFATIDHIADGRFGLNIVSGWNQPEYEMFGLDLPVEHDVRGRYGQEWWDVIRTGWDTEGEFDWSSDSGQRGGNRAANAGACARAVRPRARRVEAFGPLRA